MYVQATLPMRAMPVGMFMPAMASAATMIARPVHRGNLSPAAGHLIWTAEHFRAPALFAASAGRLPSGGDPAGGVPPAGSGGTDGKGGPKKGSDVNKRLTALKVCLQKHIGYKDLIRAVVEDIEGLQSKADRLKYLEGAGVMLDGMNIADHNMDPDELLAAVHHIVRLADELTHHITPGGKAEHHGVDEASVLRPFFRLADRLEMELLRREQLTRDDSRLIAGIHLIYAQKGGYVRTLNGEERKDEAVAALVMNAFDIFNRYNVLGLQGEAHKTLEFLEAASRHHRLPMDPLVWARETVTEAIEAHIRMYDPINKGDDDMVSMMANITTSMWDEFALGMYTFSPSVFRQLTDGFVRHLVGRQADKYARRAADAHLVAVRLGLLH